MDTPSREHFRHADELFDAALDLGPNERRAFLARACGDDAALRDRVVRLLEASDRSSGFLQSPAVELAAVLLADQPPAMAGPTLERAGPFRIVRELGHGGMGVVYLAEREGAEFEQRVALKLVRRAGASDDARRRFVEERRILARLEHPRIAHLIDGGVTTDGLPYFAMELVDGEPIDVYCDRHALSLDQRLDLVIEVCDAVQYAHEHLIIHRDLKPSNILVRADGQLKLLDFGIAKLLDPLRAADDDATQTGMIALTPEYAAPEQVRGQPVSTATDTYALGVLLYRLLAGQRPYDVRGRAPADVERIVCELEPPRPSAVAPEKLRRTLRGDLDIIVMKALHKDPARRYSTASALRDDVRRFRTGLPVLARPDRATYRLRKLVRRNRAAAGATVVAAATLLGATAFSVTQAREAQRQRDAALHEVERQRAMAEMQSVLASDSRDGDGRQLSPAQRIELAAQVLTKEFASQPWVIAEGMEELSSRLYELGERKTARALLSRARTIARHADLPTQLALVECSQAYVMAYDDELDSARSALREANAALARPGARDDIVAAKCFDAEGQVLVAEDHPDSAIGAFRQALTLAHDPRAASTRQQTMIDLSAALRAAGKTREATVYQQQVLLELDSAGYRGTDLITNVTAFLMASLSELGELAAMDSAATAAIAAQSRATGHYSSGQLNFYKGLAKLRLGDLDSAEMWIVRAMRDTTEGAGGLSGYVPPAMTQLRLEQGRVAEARRRLAELPSGTLTRRVSRSWLTARIRYAEGDRGGAASALEDSLRALAGSGAKPAPVLALPLVTAAEWRLSAGDSRGADSLARLAHAAAAVDSLASERSAYAGRAELVRARALHALGDAAAARQAAARGFAAVAFGYGPGNRHTLEARAIRDSLRH